jgi:GT2 family glycosyltransferase
MARKKRRSKELKPLVDIVIPVHRRFDLLQRCLDAIPKAAGKILYRIYIYDNASPKEEADEFYYSLDRDLAKITRSKTNYGFPKACNQAARLGHSPLLFFLNSDVILDPGSMDKMVRVLDEPSNGAVGMRLIFPSDLVGLNDQIRPAGKLQHVCLSVKINSEIYHPFMAWTPDHPRVMMQREVFAVTGAALMTRRKLFSRAGGFPEIYGMGTFEDVDYCMAVREMGYNVMTEPEATGTHYTGATSEGYQIRYDLRNNQMTFLQRWGQKLEWWDWRTL